MEVSEQEIEAAEQLMAKRRDSGHAISARYDRRASRIVVTLNTSIQLAFPPKLAEGLAGASPDNLAEIEITPSGLGLHCPRLDADLYLPALLQGIFGSKSWMARQLGATGGRAKTEAKATAARQNGQKGGRPPKRATT